MKTLQQFRQEAEAMHKDRPPALYPSQADHARRAWLATWYDEQIAALIALAGDRTKAQQLYTDFVSPALPMRDRLAQFKQLLQANGLVSRDALAAVADEPPSRAGYDPRSEAKVIRPGSEVK